MITRPFSSIAIVGNSLLSRASAAVFAKMGFNVSTYFGGTTNSPLQGTLLNSRTVSDYQKIGFPLQGHSFDGVNFYHNQKLEKQFRVPALLAFSKDELSQLFERSLEDCALNAQLRAFDYTAHQLLLQNENNEQRAYDWMVCTQKLDLPGLSDVQSTEQLTQVTAWEGSTPINYLLDNKIAYHFFSEGYLAIFPSTSENQQYLNWKLCYKTDPRQGSTLTKEDLIDRLTGKLSDSVMEMIAESNIGVRTPALKSLKTYAFNNQVFFIGDAASTPQFGNISAEQYELAQLLKLGNCLQAKQPDVEHWKESSQIAAEIIKNRSMRMIDALDDPNKLMKGVQGFHNFKAPQLLLTSGAKAITPLREAALRAEKPELNNDTKEFIVTNRLRRV